MSAHIYQNYQTVCLKRDYFIINITYLRKSLFYFKSKTKIKQGDVERQFLEDISRPQISCGMTDLEKGSRGQLAANV